MEEYFLQLSLVNEAQLGFKIKYSVSETCFKNELQTPFYLKSQVSTALAMLKRLRIVEFYGLIKVKLLAVNLSIIVIPPNSVFKISLEVVVSPKTAETNIVE